VGVGQAGDDRFTQARVGIYDGLVAVAGERVGCKEYPRHLSLNHPLDGYGQPDGRVVYSVTGPVTHGPVGPERSPAAADSFQHRFGPDNIEVSILLAGKAGKRQIFGGSR